MTGGLPGSNSPSGLLTPFGSRPKTRSHHQSARLPNPPDLLSLPSVAPIARSSTGSSLQVRYISGGLLFLKPLGTFSTLRQILLSVNCFGDMNSCFQQDLSPLI